MLFLYLGSYSRDMSSFMICVVVFLTFGTNFIFSWYQTCFTIFVVVVGSHIWDLFYILAVYTCFTIFVVVVFTFGTCFIFSWYVPVG